MKCQYCNSNISDGATVCPVCGAISPQEVKVETASPAVVEQVTPFTALKKYGCFSGRARRLEFWLFQLWKIIPFTLALLVSSGKIDRMFLIVALVMSLTLLVPELSVFCRRMHDVGKSGWVWLWNFLPLAGYLIPVPGMVDILSMVSVGILLFYTTKDSQPGSNQYGPNPKGK